uniref:BTB domain-containing protein n=1 Tax=Kalmanozyma brasiliensis (strain GHG001) TaxID=1365824 RepID=V5EPB6_KALBG
MASQSDSAAPTFEETTTISFTWTIRDLHLLREEVELSPPPSEGGRSVSAGAGKSDVWTSQPVFGDNKWKVELVRTTRPLPGEAQAPLNGLHNHVDDEETTPASTTSVDPIAIQDDDATANAPRSSITILSVYLTALVLDYTNADVEIPASIMLGLRPVRAAVGRSGAESGGYLWRRFYDYTFQKEADLFTCHDLPSVSEMLRDSSVARDDAVTLTLQLGLGPGHSRGRSSQLDDGALTRAPIEVKGHHLVPRAMLSSLHGLLDDANTGDVRILVRERGVLLPGSSERDSMSDDGHFDGTMATDSGRIVPYPVGSSLPASSAETEAGTSAPIEDDPDRIFVRDRVLWAHASVLKSRSDYFKTMLTSDFSEGISRSYGDPDISEGRGRNVRTLQISDADFVTAYRFLRYLYTDDIHFADQEDVRSAILDEEWARGADQGYLTLAHRYHMQDLSRLAALHMVATLTPQSAFPMLLATSMYEELHAQIKTYVYQHWHLVSHTQEFERCCDEVSVGMWGADAGKTMRAFVRSLVSPLRAAQG